MDALRKGDKGGAVAQLQRFLGVDDDGYFGRITEANVVEIQQKKGIAVDGVVGRQVRLATG